MSNIILAFIFGLAAAFIVFFIFKKFTDRRKDNSFSDLSRRALADLMPQMLELAKRELTSVRDEVNKDVLREKGNIGEALERLERGIKEKQEELKRLEEERNRQFGSITESLKSHKEIADKLSERTDNLGKILSSNKLRGLWGERIAEDVLQYAGLQKDVHYIKQTAGNGGTIPDFTLILANKRRINIDAKFPFDNLRAFQAAEDEGLKRQYLQKFTADVKQKIREVTSRDYINTEADTLDYVILFVPSDIVYGFINERVPEVVDEAFQKKVLLTSPTSLYATLRIIMESYRHFMYEENIREVLKIIQGFIDNFGRFKEEFGVFGETLERLKQTYDQIVETRYNKMSVQIRKIEKLEGFGKIEAPQSEA